MDRDWFRTWMRDRGRDVDEAAVVTVADIVHDDQDDVGTRRLLRPGGHGGGREHQRDEGRAHHLKIPLSRSTWEGSVSDSFIGVTET
jgi:hypothetical protein